MNVSFKNGVPSSFDKLSVESKAIEVASMRDFIYYDYNINYNFK